MAASCVKVLNGDREPTFIKYTTIDGDSCAYQGFSEQYSEGRRYGQPELLKDTRHLSLGQKRGLSKVVWSSSMFPEMTKTERLNEDNKRQCAKTFSMCYEDCMCR